MKTAITSLCGLGIFLVSGLATAQQQYGGGYQGSYSPAPMPRSSGLDNIGEEQQITFGVDRIMGISFDRAVVSPDQGGDVTLKATNVALFGNPGGGSEAPSLMIPRLSLDFFVVESISVGGSLLYFSQSTEQETSAGSNDGPTTTTFAIAPRVGYAMAFDETFSIWPRAGITYFSSKTEEEGTGGTDTLTISGLDLTLEVPVGISPIENFAILVGPYVDFGLSGTAKDEPAGGTSSETDVKVTSYGLAVGILGYY
ncbi:MAG: hypothetical protein IPM35_28390 [Myxococcales bacterium]|nr:hypothetical protein [Myxococcales bacterium]